jgi:hypothetical protein
MANRLANPNTFAGTSPNWSLALLDANATGAQGAINDSSLGFVNGPLTDSGTANAYSVTCSYGTPSAYNNGMTVFFNPANTNTGASTLTVSPLGSLAIVRADGTACTGGEILAGQTTQVVCDGTAFRIAGAAGVPAITAVRLRSFNAVGNPTFEVDQRLVGGLMSANGVNWGQDRWIGYNTTGVTPYFGSSIPQNITLPGTNFRITSGIANFNIQSVSKPSLAATDQTIIQQTIEGPMMRELMNDVHSISILAQTNVAGGLKFGLILQDNGGTRSLAKLCTLPTPNVWTLIQLPNIPVWASGGAWSVAPGAMGYALIISVAAGSSQITSANDVWVNANVRGAIGMDNILSKPANSSLWLAFIQHEPGAQCTTLMDCPFTQNLTDCQRYYCKSIPYPNRPGAAASGVYAFRGVAFGPWAVNPTFRTAAVFPKRMAKAPTAVLYSPTNGASNQIYIDGNTTYAVTSTAVNDFEISQVSLTSSSGGTTGSMLFDYTADTGW